MLPQKMLAHMTTHLPFSSRMAVLNKTNACKYYSVEEKHVQIVAAVISTDSSPENAAVWKAVNDHLANEIAHHTAEFYALQCDRFDGAHTMQMHKLKDAVIIQKGPYVICCVCKDNQKAKREAYFLLR